MSDCIDALHIDILHIDIDETGKRAAIAAQMPSGARGVVVLGRTLALRPKADGITCEVIAAPSAEDKSYLVAIVQALELLERSTIYGVIRLKPLAWIVVNDFGNDAVKLWPRG